MPRRREIYWDAGITTEWSSRRGLALLRGCLAVVVAHHYCVRETQDTRPREAGEAGKAISSCWGRNLRGRRASQKERRPSHVATPWSPSGSAICWLASRPVSIALATEPHLDPRPQPEWERGEPSFPSLASLSHLMRPAHREVTAEELSARGAG